MGRRDKRFQKSLHQQAYDRLNEMQAFGTSKKDAKADGTYSDKIFSYNTYKTYWKHTKYFLHWLQTHHPEVSTLKAARRHSNEWLQAQVDRGLSAWTIQTEAKALGKLFGIQPDDKDYFQPPVRERSEIKRSRLDVERDKHFSKTNNAELIDFARGTGCRRSELQNLRGRDLWTKEQVDREIDAIENKLDRSPSDEARLTALKDTKLFKDADFFTHVANGKGGRERWSPIVGDHTQDIVDRFKGTAPDEKVWLHVSANADIHGYRADYAKAVYKSVARPIESIPYDKVNAGTGQSFQGDVYVCRKDEAGRRLDREAMLRASKALGHNRISVVADNYLRGL